MGVFDFTSQLCFHMFNDTFILSFLLVLFRNRLKLSMCHIVGLAAGLHCLHLKILDSHPEGLHVKERKMQYHKKSIYYIGKCT